MSTVISDIEGDGDEPNRLHPRYWHRLQRRRDVPTAPETKKELDKARLSDVELVLDILEYGMSPEELTEAIERNVPPNSEDKL